MLTDVKISEIRFLRKPVDHLCKWDQTSMSAVNNRIMAQLCHLGKVFCKNIALALLYKK